jgi:putative endonuclease
MSKNKKIGNLGEELALQHCLQNGYELIEKNWTIGHKEIDLIFKKEDIYIFVEVKTRTNLKMGMPENAISNAKIKNITEASQSFLIDKQYKDVRFDVISIILKKDTEPELLHIKDAFY